MSKVESPKSVSAESELAGAAPTAHGHREGTDRELIVTDLRKSFSSSNGERIEALRSVSVSAGAGEALAIMGSSGAGKSTLLQLLGGLEVADHGSIVFGKVAIDCATPTALARFRNRQVGFVFQFHNLLPDLTAAENVSLPLLIAGTNRRGALVSATQMLAEVGLDSRAAGALVGHLSGGEQQRVAVCRALITRPGLVLADEPTGNLDSTIGAEIARTLIDYSRANGALVVLATHNHGLAATCDRTLVLREGKLYEA